MNNLYHYAYKNGVQFVTTAKPMVLGIALEQKFEDVLPSQVPKLIGVWKFKKLNKK